MNGEFRIADIGVIAAIVVNIVIGTWEVAHLDGRVEAVTRDQLHDEVTMDILSKANADKDIRMTKFDSAMDAIKGQVTDILNIVHRIEDKDALPSRPK